jgi:hypothetical protein
MKKEWPTLMKCCKIKMGFCTTNTPLKKGAVEAQFSSKLLTTNTKSLESTKVANQL